MKSNFLFVLLLSTVCSFVQAQTGNKKYADLPAGYWPVATSQPIIDKIQTSYLSPDLSGLSNGELSAIDKLNQAGRIFQSLYELQRHPQSVSSLQQLEQLDKRLGSPTATKNLLTLYRLNQGPITTTLENKREPFLPITNQPAGVGMYPADATKEEIDAFLAANPDSRNSILHPRTVVRRATAANIKSDVKKLSQYPALDALHIGLKRELQGLKVNPKTFYAVPYSIAYADQLLRAYALLNEAALAVEKDDAEYAGYLRNRSRDLLTNDYESGDAAWVTGHFKNLNSQIGSYETYDDPLYGVKTFFSLAVLKSRPNETANLKRALSGMQDLENSLPYENHKHVKEDISVGVYDVISDFAQSRGGNTATILPNESLHSRRYGRTIMIRANILQNPEIFNASLKGFQVAVIADQGNDLTPDGNFYRVLWHEIGHYLGVDGTKNGEELDAVLQENADIYEEMKADLVSLFVAEALQKKGYYTKDQLRSVYASGIRRVLLDNQPRRSQPYQTMQLMQWNFFMENGLLAYNTSTQKLTIDYERYHSVIGKLLTKVLDIQYQGDKAASDRFIEQYTKWDDHLHGILGKNIRDQQTYRFRLFRYAALGEK
ncbi:MAG TPA: hypothetical protein VFG10_08265 [Saprospiraceae bacterium]|nr:hypothetical protein [Saprospiraceae bacterium]